MTVQLAITTAGLAAIADNSNRATRAVALTRMALGAGTAPVGTDETARTQLRRQIDIVDAQGQSSITTAGRIGLIGRFRPTVAYDVTEIGVFARIGASGAEFLFGYWAGADLSDAITVTSIGALSIVVGVVQFGTTPAAEVSIAADLNLNLGTTPASETAAGIVELATCAEAAAGTDTERATTPAGLACARNAWFPAGVVVAFGGDAVPGGWLELDGQAVSRTTYPALFALWGTTYGDGDGSTTFGLPNLARRTIVGAGGAATPVLGNAVGDSGGSESHTLTVAEMPAHNHGRSTGTTALRHRHAAGTLDTLSSGTHRHNFNVHYGHIPPAIPEDRDRNVNGIGPDTLQTKDAGAHTHDITGSTGYADDTHSHWIPSQGGGGAHSILQPSFVMRWIVSTG